MYQASIRIYICGVSDEAVEIIDSVDGYPSIACKVMSEGQFALEKAKESQLIILGGDPLSITEALRKIRDIDMRDIDIILLANALCFDEFAPYFDMLEDIWPADMSDDELAWRFGRWQRLLKEHLDAWETNQFLESTINSIPSLVWYKTKDGIHEKVNDSFCETVNKPKDDVQGKRHAYIWDVEEDDPVCIESEEKVMSSGQTCISEEIVQSGDETKILTTYKSPLYNPDGSVMGTVGVAIDATQERAYENDLVQKNQTLETIFTAMECGVLTHSLDGTRVVGVNKAALDILGYSSEDDMLSHGFEMIASSVVDEDKEQLREKFESLSNVGDSVSTEYRVKHADGSILHVMGNIKLIEQNGELLYQRFLLDNSEQKRKEEMLERRSQEFMKVLSEYYLVICAFNLESGKGELLRVAQEREEELIPIFGAERSFEEAVEDYVAKRVYEEDAEMLRETLSTQNVIKELSTRERLHVHYRSKEGDSFKYRQVVVVRASNWNEQRYVVLGIRNTDQETREEIQHKELLEEALVRASRASEAKSAFLSNMSHDIRTPMNAIVGFTVLANNHLENTQRVKEYLDKIHSSSSHLLSLINDILDMSRIESGKASLDERPCLISDIFSNIENILMPEVETKGLIFNVSTKNVKHNAIVCDELKLNQILLNLLGNSIKFTGSNGVVDLDIAEIGEVSEGFAHYKITVRDNGIGMTRDFLKHIFDPFERERTSTLSGIQGTGLGMTITKSLVDMMDGVITVQSKKGIGTQFDMMFKFEVVDEEATKLIAVSTKSDVALSERLKGCRILLVDDNELNREIALTLLEDAGFEVESAVNGQDAIDRLIQADSTYFQLVLMDIQMPIMNGYEAATIIRAMDDPIVSSIPILAVTADAFDEDKQKALSCGMNGHLPKPIEVSELFKAMDTMLS